MITLRKVRKILITLCAFIFFISTFNLLKILLIDPFEKNRDDNYIKEIYYQDKNLINDNNSTQSKLSILKDINSDIIGWINIPDTIIDYPILQPPKDDSNFYLNHNYKKEKSRYGSIFIDPNNTLGMEVKNLILHGHHMRDGSMFAVITKFSDLNFYQEHPIIVIDTGNEVTKYKIISIFKTNTKKEHGEIFDYIKNSFKDKKDFLDYIHNVKIRSLLDVPVDVNDEDSIVPLSTCSYEFEDFRTVLVARRIRDGEEDHVDVEKAKKSNNPLMPDCWYKKYGGTPLNNL